MFQENVSKITTYNTTYKKSHPEKTLSLGKIREILDGKDGKKEFQDDARILAEIEKKAQDTNKDFGDKKKAGDQLSQEIDNLPLKLGSTIKDWIKNLVENHPILGFLVGLIMGPEFLNSFLDKNLSEKEKKRKDSLVQLETLSKESSSSVSGIFGAGFFKTLDTKKLSAFFELLESEDIDYSKNNFWQEILSEKSDNTKIGEISQILKEKNGKNIFEKGDTKNGGKRFIAKLNAVPKIIAEKKAQENKAKIAAQAAALPPVSSV